MKVFTLPDAGGCEFGGHVLFTPPMQISPDGHSSQLHPNSGELAFCTFLYPALQVHAPGLNAPGPVSALGGQKQALRLELFPYDSWPFGQSTE
jgi:hypothetical protein